MAGTRMSRRGLLAAGLGGGLGLGFAGCAWGRETAPEGTTQLKVWDSFTVEPVNGSVKQLYKAFGAARVGATVDRNIVNYDQMVALSKTAMASGSGPDLIYYSVGKGNAGILVEAGLIAPLDEVAPKNGWRTRLAPFALREASIDGKLYGLPHESEVSGWWYNKSLFDKHSLQVPETIDDLLELTKAAKRLGLQPVAYGQGDIYTPFWLFSQLACNIMQSEPLGDLVYDDKGSWDTPEIVQGIQTVFTDLARAGTFGTNVNSMKAQDAVDLWTQEKALMLIGGSWSTGEFSKAFPGKEIGIMPMPAFDGEHRVFSAGSGGAYWVSAKSKSREAAKEFLEFVLGNQEAVRIWVEDAKLIPPVEFDSSGWKISALQKNVIEAASGAGDPAKNLGYQVNHGLASAPFLNMMTAGFQAMFANDKSAQAQAKDLQAAWAKGLR
jgi:raffinose/stachyose/melibiose transport system substrate-binding protein